MMARGWALGLLACGLVGGCDLFYPSEPLRYRMTVTVDTPDGTRSGSSVLESTITAGTRFGDASGIRYRMEGEAVTVPLPNGKVLFVLLRSQDIGDPASYHANLMQVAACRNGHPSETPPPSICEGGNWQEFRNWARNEQLSVELDHSIYPMVVTFGDIENPSTVESVNPNNLEAEMGYDYRIKIIDLQITKNPLQHSINRLFPNRFWKTWAGENRKNIAQGDAMKNPYFKSLMGTLNRGDFISEKRQ